MSRFLSVRVLLISGALLALGLYVAGVPGNPPGFFVDESSIAYNAYTISQHGLDEHGESWPLFFRAFGEHKNPVLIYLLASLYWVFGPSQFLARLLSALLVLAAALLLGALAGRVTRQRPVGIIVGASACLTPWLFEPSNSTPRLGSGGILSTPFIRRFSPPPSRDRTAITVCVLFAPL